jgi:hypothetical protein
MRDVSGTSECTNSVIAAAANGPKGPEMLGLAEYPSLSATFRPLRTATKRC